MALYVNRKDYKSAMIVAKANEENSRSLRRAIVPSSAGSAPLPGSQWLSASKTISSEDAFDSTPGADAAGKRLITKSAMRLLRAHLDRSQSMAAAATLVSVGEVAKALQLLDLNGEFDLALALSDALGEDSEVYVQSTATSLAQSGEIEEALLLLQARSKNVEESSGKLLVSVCKDENEASFWIAKMKLRSLHWWAHNACEEELIGQDDNAILSYALSWQFAKAATMGLNILKQRVRSALSLSPSDKATHSALKNIRIVGCEVPRLVFLSFMLWFGAHEAAELGHWSIGAFTDATTSSPPPGFLRHILLFLSSPRLCVFKKNCVS